MISARVFFNRVFIFVSAVGVVNILGYLVPFIEAIQPSYHAYFQLAVHQSAKIDMYANLDASSLTISPSAGTKFELTDVEPQVKTSPLELHGVKLQTDDQKIFDKLSLHTGSNVTILFNWQAQYGEQDGAFILESSSYRGVGQVETNVQSTYVFRNLPAGIYILSAERQSSGASSLSYAVNGTIARYKTQGVPQICNQSCKWSRFKHGARYAVISAGGQDASVAMDGYFTYPHQFAFQSLEIIIFVFAFVVAFVIYQPDSTQMPSAKIAGAEKAVF